MPPKPGVDFPTRDDVIEYLSAYEPRYQLRSNAPSRLAVNAIDGGLEVVTDRGPRRSKMVVSATGTWSHPLIPEYPGRTQFAGLQTHSAQYRSPEVSTG
ncbi:NAD(P)-binding domain-containing protein [Brevundimonas sp.]|jgi:putative flavoprotein involved in K+ transport|uniref:NAD(P)-binding domain-containing protein n=1 Tax=Brevundimonas sp. TaxID=1871086 RepID=UPI00289BAA9B|nr:NAD(P)-binding domain-containing protein [Brevundimonas sp.]